MKVLLFCAKGFETMEFSAFVDVLGWARENFGCPVEVDTCGFEKTVVSTFGVPVTMDRTVDEVEAGQYDAIAVPGGFEAFGFYEEAYHWKLLTLLDAFNRQGKPIASVCTAALALGKSGILKHRRATTYHIGDSVRQTQLAAFGAQTTKKRFAVDGNVITSCGPETAPEVAFILLEMLCGKEKADAVRAAMGFAPQDGPRA